MKLSNQSGFRPNHRISGQDEEEQSTEAQPQSVKKPLLNKEKSHKKNQNKKKLQMKTHLNKRLTPNWVSRGDYMNVNEPLHVDECWLIEVLKPNNKTSSTIRFIFPARNTELPETGPERS